MNIQSFHWSRQQRKKIGKLHPPREFNAVSDWLSGSRGDPAGQRGSCWLYARDFCAKAKQAYRRCAESSLDILPGLTYFQHFRAVLCLSCS